MSRNRLWAFAVSFFAVALAIEAWSPPAALAFVALGVGVGIYVALKNRPTSGPFSISTECQRCGAILQSRAGIPDRTCVRCGQRQSWAR